MIPSPITPTTGFIPMVSRFGARDFINFRSHASRTQDARKRSIASVATRPARVDAAAPV
jgi:hypothetical protein